MKGKNNYPYEPIQTYQSIKLSTLVQNIHQAGRPIYTSSEHTDYRQNTQFDQSLPCLKKVEQRKYINRLYQSYQMEKKAVQQGLLTPQHLNKYLQPRKRHFNLKKEINFLKKTTLQTCISKLRAANIILNGKKSQQGKNEIIQETIESKKGQLHDIEFIQKMNECQLQQRMGKLLKIKSAPHLFNQDQP